MYRFKHSGLFDILFVFTEIKLKILFTQRRIISAVVLAFAGALVIRASFFSIKNYYESRHAFFVRVRVLNDAREVLLSSGRHAGCIKFIPSGQKIQKEGSYYKAEVLPHNGYLMIGEEKCPGEIRVLPSKDGTTGVNGTFYRGKIEILEDEGKIDVINTVELEDYLKGVVPREMNRLWPMEALKAQAIASRTYAVMEALRRKNKKYDLRADTYSQVYGGCSAERWRTDRAVNATRNKVLVYAGKVLPAYFHSCCGGHTEDAAVLWGSSYAPLEGVRCPFCRWSPYYRWQVSMKGRDILKTLKQAGYDINRIDDIKTGLRDRSGRLEYVSVKTGNRWLDIKAVDFVKAVGSRVLKSTKFRVNKYPFFYRFAGYGWGHGVGLCQWGAFWMAFRWKSAERILDHYYPGSEIADMRKVLQVNEAR